MAKGTCVDAAATSADRMNRKAASPSPHAYAASRGAKGGRAQGSGAVCSGLHQAPSGRAALPSPHANATSRRLYKRSQEGSAPGCGSHLRPVGEPAVAAGAHTHELGGGVVGAAEGRGGLLHVIVQFPCVIAAHRGARRRSGCLPLLLAAGWRSRRRPQPRLRHFDVERHRHGLDGDLVVAPRQAEVPVCARGRGGG